MDKYEYKVCLEDIKALIARRQYGEAAKIADTIDWRRVKSVKTLCMISDLYKVCHRCSEARDILYLAYQRDGENPQIIYAMCLLELQLDEYLRALQLYNEFLRVSPRDPGRFILQYKLYQAQNVSLDEQIAVLEELKKRVFKDKWVYELAGLYDRRGLYGRCAELCDELIAGGKTKYVREALELKRTHSPLTPEQEAEYNRIMAVKSRAPIRKAPAVVKRSLSQEAAETAELSGMEYAGRQTDPGTQEEIHVRPLDEGMASTVNLQAAVAEGLQEIMKKEPEQTGSEEHGPKEKAGESESSARQDQSGDETPKDFQEASRRAREVRSRMNDEEGNPARKVQELRRQKADYDAQMAQETDGQFSLRVDEHALAPMPKIPAVPKTAARSDLVRRGVESWEEIRRKTDEKNAELNRKKVRDTTGPILEEFDEKASRSVVEEIEERNADDARMQRYRRSMPQGGSLSDGMTENERVNVSRARADGSADNLVRDEDADTESSTRVWREDEQRRARRRTQEQEDDIPEDEQQTEGRPEPEEGSAELPEDEQQTEGGPDTEERPAELPEDEHQTEDGPEPEKDSDELPGNDQSQNDEPEEEPRKSAHGKHSWPGNAVKEASTEEEQEKEDGLSATQEIAELIRQEFAKTAEDSASTAEKQTQENNAAGPGKPEESAETVRSESGRRREQARKMEKVTEDLASVRETSPMDDASRAAADLTARAEEERRRVRHIRREAQAVREDRRAFHGEQEVPGDDHPDTESHPGRETLPLEQHSENAEFSSEPERDTEEEPVQGSEQEPQPESTDGAPDESGTPSESDAVSDAAADTDRRDADRIRNMSREQKKLFGSYLRERNTRTKLLDALDNVSLASYTGNVAIAGYEEAEASRLAKAILKNAKQTDSNFSGKVAVISGAALNHKDPEDLISRVDNGGLIVERASSMSAETCAGLHKALEREDRGVIVILVDSRHGMDRLFRANPGLTKNFTSRVDIIPLSDDELVHLGVRYANRRGFSMDDMARLALHSRVASMQKINHHVTAMEVQTIVDEAIDSATKKTFAHLMDSLFGKRRDEDGRIVLREKNFSASKT